MPYLKEGWVLVDTHKYLDPDSHTVWGDHKIEPDMALYARKREPEEHICQYSQMDVVGEFKLHPSDEPFCFNQKAKKTKMTKTKKMGKIGLNARKMKKAKPFEREFKAARET